ncbi:malate dehydrogenase (NAD) [Thermaerobacter marianensis DSM 12885]|uniref:Malate dehydrogenase n=1 Tax=Thermaerobacter marianensis (strain ATCC 700841 / DSM 12885 / JCM 10246 / 7p75a) TaxID=644966 RepID=E6SLT2_THEM7|nr:malate dehydrogenase [Thermaerobacter marianensis]7AOB_A Chain A, Malate dehydrogenase [Thermaerobacter marianensis]7AOB_B Chain B, Malate dehydrogenase [Thermaerobacter marianensis]7AOB_C Chain C, Malate dehydrogenase [Thermaerobacter marianensis]7AOB_D Chain D, Malate dehydrogenase [Thermaerobacter marianensis]ADU51381.1 malate dehydrogenase (NAD) [Thermaerobacter marianensis DSM 12885]
MKRPKVSIVGAGNTGAALAHWLAIKQVADIVLVDVVEGMPQGKALDLMQSAPVEGFDVVITGSNDYAATAGSDVVVITAGAARKPGMSRDDLVNINTGIVREITAQVARYSPDAYLIVLTNPLDVMCYVAYKVSGFPKHRVMGQSGILDSARFRTFIARELNVSFEDVHALVLGGHGDSMVPLPRYTHVGGIPVTQLLPKEKIDELVRRTRDGGAEIVRLLKTGSAFFAPGAAMAEMVEAILRDRKRVLPVSAYLEGEYGESGIFMGVPVVLGGNGIEKILEIELTDEERQAFARSAADVRQTLSKLDL